MELTTPLDRRVRNLVRLLLLVRYVTIIPPSPYVHSCFPYRPPDLPRLFETSTPETAIDQPRSDANTDATNRLPRPRRPAP